MSKNYNNSESHKFGNTRHRQQNEGMLGSLEKNFSRDVLLYLEEKIMNHLLDSITLDFPGLNLSAQTNGRFNDYSFLTAPAYKALEGFLFQIAKDLNLPSSRNNNVGGYYFDEQKRDKQIDKLLKELENRAESSKLSTYEKRDIKDRIKEMKGFLQHYRHTPAHFFGEPIETVEKAHRNIMVIYSAIDNATKILLKAKLIKISDI